MPRVLKRLRGVAHLPPRRLSKGLETLKDDPLFLSAGLSVAGPGEMPWLAAEVGEELGIVGQNYSLVIAAGDTAIPAARIRARGAAGLRHALATLVQLFRQYHDRIPAIAIEDEPAFETRGVMLDVSRDRVPTMAELLRIVDDLSALKINHLQLYTEHTFAYVGHEAAWTGWSPITPDEVRELDAHCQQRGMALTANQNCFGHLASWLRLPQYAHLAETHGDWVFDAWPRSGPFSLCPTDPASLAFVEDLLSQLLPCFSTPLVNIGCDETYDVGYGRSKEEVARRGRAAVYLEFVSKIAAVARRHGKRPMFWADIALSNSECVKDIPAEMISLAWGYEPDSPFEKWCELLAATGRETWVCPGTSSWRSITGRTTERRANIVSAAAAGRRGGATGFLICDWGDTGHHQQWPVAMHGVADGAQAAWNPDAAFSPDSSSLHALGDASLQTGRWLEAVGDVDKPLRETCLALSRPGKHGRLLNQTAIFIDMHKKLNEDIGVGEQRDWRASREAIDGLAERVPSGVPRLLADELSHTADMARFAASRAEERRRPGGIGAERTTMFRQWVGRLIGEHRRLWLIRSREGGLEHSCGFWKQIAGSFDAD